ncbi:AfsR/SARP family transcriptional regulator [Stackebrandtia soli]|uniref:AfsR/SARP family transcriptional regulator n=1 Tax=Stackebrandtia soli TaxID=1892856 RepID=UPI0039E9D255
MEFRILGPLEVSDGAASVPIRGRHHPKVLGLLLSEAGKVVPANRLMEGLWDDTPPETAFSQVQNIVGALRRQLGVGGALVETVGQGYRIAVESERLDASRCERFMARARRDRADGKPEEALAQVRAALDEWRGPALAGLSGRMIESIAARLNEYRVAIVEERVTLELQLGEQRGLVEELTGLIAEHPLHEGLRGHLMLALYRAGRTSDALAVYNDAREQLSHMVGLDPGRRLSDLQGRILRSDPTLDECRRATAVPQTDTESSAADGSRPPDFLPSEVSQFVGRDDQLASLDGLLSAHGTGSAIITAVSGGGGVGKTALAVRWAHLPHVRANYKDGSLYVQLQGFSAHTPITAEDAVDQLLRQLNVPGWSNPSNLDEGLSLLRRSLDGRRMLILLDNARNAEQVRPLLTALPSCLVVVTSRDRMTGLAVREGAHQIFVDRLSMLESIELIRELFDADVATRNPEAIRELAAVCARLPLAIRVAAAGYRNTHPDTPLSTYVEDIAADRLGTLDADGDPDVALSAVLSWSLSGLAPDVITAFHELGLHPGPSLDRTAAAAIMDTTDVAAARMLRRLQAASLVEEAAPGRYVMHDLLRDYSREHTTLPEPDQTVARDRLLDHYSRALGSEIVTANATRAEANWFSGEHAALIACLAIPGTVGHRVRFALRLGYQQKLWNFSLDCRPTYEHARDLATPGTVEYFRAVAGIGNAATWTSDWDTASRCLNEALGGFTALGDLNQQGWVLRDLTELSTGRGEYAAALEYGHRALTVFREAKDLGGEADALVSLASQERTADRCESALEYGTRAVELAQRLGLHDIEAETRSVLADSELKLGHVEAAREHALAALAISRRRGERATQASACRRLSRVAFAMRDLDAALSYSSEAVRLFGELGDRMGQGVAWHDRGEMLFARKDFQGARECHDRARDICRELGNRVGEASTGKALGDVLLAEGDSAKAMECYRAALDRLGEVTVPRLRGRIHTGLGRAAAAAGDVSTATRELRRALEIFEQTDATDAIDVREALAELTCAD